MELNKDWEILLKQAELLGFEVTPFNGTLWGDTIRVSWPGGWADFFLSSNEMDSEELKQEFVEYMRDMTDETRL